MEEEENGLWELGLLGNLNAQTLLDKMVWMCGLHFALHSGLEHQNLRPDQIKLFEPPGSPAYLLYTEDASKNNLGGNTVHRICTKAGIPGYKTNHLLRVSAVTRLFQKDVDEQLIISVTGHCSIDGVRAYKCASDNQKQQLSEHLQAKTCNKENIPDVENEPATSVKPSLTSVATPVM